MTLGQDAAVDGRTPLVAGNWKMFKTRSAAEAFADELLGRLDDLGPAVDLAVCPPFTALDVVVARLVPHGVGVWAQNGYAAREGAFTGEVSMAMLADAGATGVLLGHSERRLHFGETDAALAEKLTAALDAGLEPVLCVGETEEERSAGRTEERLRTQIVEGLALVALGRLAEVVVAYEPVWAIGTGRTATPEIAQEAHRFIRALLADRFGPPTAAAVRILYGGSVKADNAASLLVAPDIDGALVGGASLEVGSLLAIAAAASGAGA